MKSLGKMTRGLVAASLGALAVTALPAPAHADDTCVGGGQDCPVYFDVVGPDDANVGATFQVEITVHFPAGDYRQMALDVTLPSGVSYVGSASPTTQEFDNSIAITGGRRWLQQNTLDFTGGAANRKFNITVSTATRTAREGTIKDFAVHLTGNVADDVGGNAVPVTYTPADHATTLHGTATFTWTAFGGGNGSGAILSDEATPRAGILRRFVFLPGNGGNALLDAPTTWSASFGSGYTFVRAFGSSWSSTFLPDPNNPNANLVVDSAPAPWTTGAATVAAHSLTANVGVAFYVDLFVPCDAFGKSQAESDAQGDAYLVNATAHAVQTDATGAVINTFDLTHAPIGALTLTSTCGQGGQVTKIEDGIVLGGTGFRWQLGIAPPFGVSVIHDAMLVDVLPPETEGVSLYGGNSSDTDFTRWTCNFSAFPGYFTAAEFLARRDANCRSGLAFLPGDTHVVFFAPEWQAEDGALRPVTLWLMTRTSEAWARANPGMKLGNTVYFNGDVDVFADLGDTAVETGSEDPWEAARLSDPVPTSGTNNLSMSRNGVPTNPGSSLVDANGGAGKAYVHMAHGTGLYSSNPEIAMSYPPGIIVSGITDLTFQNCSAGTPDAAHQTSPGAGPWTSPAQWSAGDASEPWALAPDNCTLVGRIDFNVDPDYPWIDGQAITFNATGTADGAPAKTAAISFFAQVTTGMDVLLDGGCWTSASPVQPPQPGLLLYQATAVNRGSDDLSDMELRFIVPQYGIYRIALPGPDFPAGSSLEVSRDHGTTWGPAPTLADATVTDVRATGIDILGEGLSAKRPSFFVGIIADEDAPTSTIDGGAWVRTDSFELGQTPTKEVGVDPSLCAAPCSCPDPTPADACSTGACDLNGACIVVNADNGTSCAIEADRCVTAAACQAGACTPTQVTACDDGTTCTSDKCNPSTGQCGFSEVFDCKQDRPFYLPVSKDGKVVGAVVCHIVSEGNAEFVKCDENGGRLVLHRDQANACGL
ncbi:MAG: hypothetical protein U1F43_24985 [Myxococcota bacterium]